ncbi:MAG: hypothetical protein J7L25_15060 [Deltaproteobacteria bacterium]|nr:hypothetical protein [Candidatus Tharpella aukensis]
MTYKTESISVNFSGEEFTLPAAAGYEVKGLGRGHTKLLKEDVFVGK